MTEKKLERYIGIKQEIKQLEQYMTEGVPQSSDVVRSSAEWPYSPHSVSITGADEKLWAKWYESLERNRQLKAEIERFIEAVPDEQVRLAMRCRYYDGLPWQAIAMKCGGYDEKTPRNWVKKYLKNSGNSAKPLL